MELSKLREEMYLKKSKVKLQTPRPEIFTDPSRQQDFAHNLKIYQEFLADGQKISEKSLLTRFTK